MKDHFTNKWRALFDSAQKTSGILPQISGLCWSPDGRVLAVLFQDGGVFFLETETGKITYYVKLSYAPIFFKWSQIVSCSSFDDDDCPFYNVSFLQVLLKILRFNIVLDREKGRWTIINVCLPFEN